MANSGSEIHLLAGLLKTFATAFFALIASWFAA